MFNQAYLLLSSDPDYDHHTALVDADLPENEELIRKFKVKSFPTVLIFGPLNKYQGISYKGEASAEAYASALRLYTGYSAIRLSSPKELLHRSSMLMESFVLGIFDDEGELYQKFVNASKQLNFVRFYYLEYRSNSTEERHLKESGVYIVHNPFFTEDEAHPQLARYNESWNGTLDAFIVFQLSNAVEICTQQTIKLYRILRSRYLAVFMNLYEDINATKRIGHEMTPFAQKYRGKFRVCLSNVETNTLTKDLLGGEVGEVGMLEANGTAFQGKGMIHVDPKQGPKVNAKELEAWVEKCLAGKLEPVDFKKRIEEVRNRMREERRKKQAEDRSKAAGKGGEQRLEPEPEAKRAERIDL